MKTLIIIFVFKLFLPEVQPDNNKFNPGIDILHYEFNIALNDTTDYIEGFSVIKAQADRSLSKLYLDLKGINDKGMGMRIKSITINNNDCDWEHTGNKISVSGPFELKNDSTFEIKVIYKGIPADGLIISKNKFGDRTFFTDNWPDRASNYLPVVDHPSDKATVDFIITAPSTYRVVASGHLIEESFVSGQVVMTHWREETPIPVKVMAFGAAPFAVQLAGVVKDIPVWTWVFYQNRKEGFSDYSVAVKPLEFYSSLIGPYSYNKLANVQSKTRFGGMENAGCIFYSESSVSGKGRAENLIAHEIAHQWFGNSVTEKEWPHIWLSEGFATYLAAVYLEKTYGVQRLRTTMASARAKVIKESEKKLAPVIDTTISDLMKLLNANSYQKGAWVLHMLRNEVGEENFWNGIRLYYRRFMNGNALTEDFLKVMSETSGRDLEMFFHQWLYVAGQPELKITTARGRKKGTVDIIVEQVQNNLFSFSIELLLEDSEGARTINIPIRGKVTSMNVEAGDGLKVSPDPDIKLLFKLAGS